MFTIVLSSDFKTREWASAVAKAKDIPAKVKDLIFGKATSVTATQAEADAIVTWGEKFPGFDAADDGHGSATRPLVFKF